MGLLMGGRRGGLGVGMLKDSDGDSVVVLVERLYEVKLWVDE